MTLLSAFSIDQSASLESATPGSPGHGWDKGGHGWDKRGHGWDKRGHGWD